MLLEIFLILEDAEIFPYEGTPTMETGSYIEVCFLDFVARLDGLL
jgi:hypothetical protein